MFMDDNARPHRANSLTINLTHEWTQLLIEYARNVLGRCEAVRSEPQLGIVLSFALTFKNFKLITFICSTRIYIINKLIND